MDMKKVVMVIALLGCASPFGMAFGLDGGAASTPSEEQKPSAEQPQPLPEEPVTEESAAR
jgi:hypothetical protein